MTPIEVKIKSLIQKQIEQRGYKILNVKLGTSEGRNTLTVTISKDGNLSVEDCAKVSKIIGPILDETNSIQGSYTLVVSSPGVD